MHATQNLLIIAKSLFISAFSLTFLTMMIYFINLKAKSTAITKLYYHLRRFSLITCILTFIFFVLAAWNILQIKMILLLSILPIMSLIILSLNRKKLKN